MSDLPHSLEAEAQVIGAVMLRPESLPLVSDWLKAEDFYVREHGLIYTAILELDEKKTPFDAVTVAEWFEANALAEIVTFTFVLELANRAISAANVVAHAEIVAEHSRLRKAIEIGARLAAAAVERGADSARIMGEAAQELAHFQASKVRTGLKPAKGALRGLVAEMDERMRSSGGLLGLPTPWKGVNDCTRGLRPGVLYVIGARPSMGKSILGFQLAAFTALRGLRVGLFSVEMGESEVIGRMVSCCGEIPHDWIEFPAAEHPDSEIYWSRVTNVTAGISQSGLLIDDTPALKIEQLTARAKRAHMQAPIKLIVIDHLHDLAFDGNDEMRFKVGRAVQGAKSLAKDLGIPVVLLAQLNRSVAGRTDKTPNMTDLRESGEIEQKADVIFFLHRDDYYDKNTHLQGVVKLIPAKGRNIKIGDDIVLHNRYDQMRLDDWIGPLPQKPEEPPKESRRSIGTKAARSYASKDE